MDDRLAERLSVHGHLFIELAVLFGKFVAAVSIMLFDQPVLYLLQLTDSHIDFELSHLQAVSTGQLNFPLRHSTSYVLVLFGQGEVDDDLFF